MSNLFNKISDNNKVRLLKMLEANTFEYTENTTILSTMKEQNIIGVVLTGYIQIIRTDYNGNRTIIEELYEGDVFGTLISSLKSNDYDMITKEKSKILIIDYDQVLNQTESNSTYYNTFLKNLLEIVTDRIREKNERIEILTKKTIRNKLLEYFRIVSSKHGSRYVYLPHTFQDLADYLAVDRCAMSRELKYLKEEGFIEVKGKRITLLYR